MTVYRDHQWRFSEEYHCMIFVRPDYEPETEYVRVASKPRGVIDPTKTALVGYLQEHTEGFTRDMAVTLGISHGAIKSSLYRHARMFRVVRYCGDNGEVRAVWGLV